MSANLPTLFATFDSTVVDTDRTANDAAVIITEYHTIQCPYLPSDMHSKCVPNVSALSTSIYFSYEPADESTVDETRRSAIQLSFEPPDWSAIDETYSSTIWPAVLQALASAKQGSVLYPQQYTLCVSHWATILATECLSSSYPIGDAIVTTINAPNTVAACPFGDECHRHL